MLNNEKKSIVYTDINNERGMTFISMFLTLVIIAITLPFLIYFLQNIHTSTYKEDMSVQQFFIFVRNDAISAKHVYSKQNRLLFDLKSGEQAKIEYYPKLIRRQVDGKGHEIYLRDIESFSIQPLSYGSKLVVTTLKGETYEKTIAHYNE